MTPTTWTTAHAAVAEWLHDEGIATTPTTVEAILRLITSLGDPRPTH